jgi:hypothetical protein
MTERTPEFQLYRDIRKEMDELLGSVWDETPDWVRPWFEIDNIRVLLLEFNAKYIAALAREKNYMDKYPGGYKEWEDLHGRQEP